MLPINRNKKKNGKGCLFLIIGTLLVLAATAVYVILTGQLTGSLINARYDGKVLYALMTASTPCLVIAFLLFDGILILKYLPSQEDYEKDKKAAGHSLSPMLGEKKKGMGKRTVNLICGLLLVAAVGVGIISSGTYCTVSDEGITTTFCHIQTGQYTWQQVSAYKIDCDSDRGLSVTFTMRDGKQFEILQNVVSATDEFHEQYPSTTAYAATIDERLEELQVPRNVAHMERAVAFYRASYPDLWPYVKQIIGYSDLIPEEGELADTTEGLTEGLAENPTDTRTPAHTDAE